MVTGKGGVGKSFTAALLAAETARAGRKTLLVEMGPWSFLEKALDLPSRRSLFSPLSTPYGFDHAVWTGEDCLTDYVKYLVKVPWAAEAFLKNAWLRSLIKVAPGLREISFLGKLTSQVRKHGPPLPYDTLVVDAVSSGHYLNLLRTPAGLSEVTRVGPLREQAEGINEVLNDKKTFHTVVVSNLESFSVQESFELTGQMKSLVHSDISYAANKIYPVPPENPPQDSNEVAQKFINEQIQLRDFQRRQIKQFEEASAPLHKIEFLFQPLKDVLIHDYRKLFTGL
jgi:anion-transporting  ArsA/GET3 family ATPase